MNFTEEQLEILEKKGRALTPAYIVSRDGIKENLIWGLSHRWGLLKIRFPTTKRAELLPMANELAEKTNSQILFVFGGEVIYYRKHPTVSVDDLFK
jgi:RNA-binding protein YhbY